MSVLQTVCECCRFAPTDSGIFGVPLTTLLENDQKKYPGSRVPLVFKKVRSSFLLWLLETRLECCDRDWKRQLFWKVPSQHFSGLRYSSLPHPWTEPRRAISHYPDPTAHACLRYRGFPKKQRRWPEVLCFVLRACVDLDDSVFKWNDGGRLLFHWREIYCGNT